MAALLLAFWLRSLMPAAENVPGPLDLPRHVEVNRQAMIKIGTTTFSDPTTAPQPSTPPSACHQAVIGIYVDEVEARRAFPALAMRAKGRGASTILADDHAQTFLAWGHFAKLMEWRFRSDAPLDCLSKLIAAGLTVELSETSPAEVRQAAQALLDALRVPKAVTQLQFFSEADGHISLFTDKRRVDAGWNPKLTRAFWNYWLGPKSPVAQRRALVAELPALGQ